MKSQIGQLHNRNCVGWLTMPSKHIHSFLACQVSIIIDDIYKTVRRVCLYAFSCSESIHLDVVCVCVLCWFPLPTCVHIDDISTSVDSLFLFCENSNNLHDSNIWKCTWFSGIHDNMLYQMISTQLCSFVFVC